MIKHLYKFITLLSGLICLQSASAAPVSEITLYSARKEALIQPLLTQFTQQTGISVNLLTAKADALLKRLSSEGMNSPADILLTTDAGRLYRAKAAGVTQAFDSSLLHSLIPASYRDPENHWYGLSLRFRPILYVKGKLDPAELSTYEALADSKWKHRICIRSSGNIYNQSLVASLIASNGTAATEQWAKSLVANLARPPKGGDRDQIKAAAAGQCDIAIANTYYLAGMLNSGQPDQVAAAKKMAVFWPNQAGRGAHVNISGAALTKASKNRANAIKLIEFLASDASQQWYAETNGEYPVRRDIPVSATLKNWGEFKTDDLNLSQLGTLNGEALMLMDRAGWK
ncbi:MAG: Fe(3+) ABC transporter substrate-binding protein [Gammaproteobacteria bacterium]|nr:Fe(3+) ABC transporter substrate-binding protein [Gammaproteobacteria bacterium]